MHNIFIKIVDIRIESIIIKENGGAFSIMIIVV